MSTPLTPGSWAILAGSRLHCQVIQSEQTWGETYYRVFLPETNETRQVPSALLLPLESGAPTLAALRYAAAGARILEALATDSLVAPLKGRLIPLPHQLYALSRAMSGSQVRYLFADEVGLGKTIEAGLVMRELKARGRAKRILVVAPAGLQTQWVQEMKGHFDEEFRLVQPGQFGAFRQFSGLDERENLWTHFNQVVTSLDAVKPMESRCGWSQEQVERYNRERFNDLVTAGWDLIVIDEAHRMGGSTDDVARYRLGEALGQAAPNLLLLSATPHQGKTDGFRRLMGLLDPDAFTDLADVKRERVAPYVIRTEKRRAIDAEGRPLFQPRIVQLRAVDWDLKRPEQQALYNGVTQYVRKGYNQALRAKDWTASFLMILMQRLVTSSTRAITGALAKRLTVLDGVNAVQPSFLTDELSVDEMADLSEGELMDRLLESRLHGVKDERAEVMRLLSIARRSEANGPDAKAQALLNLIYELQQSENDPDVKLLIFTEFVQTQQMLAEFLAARGFRVTCLNGSLGLEQRRDVQMEFRQSAQILISTDAGGEGLNLQFCHVVVNYDLPWNPMKLEQRIGRVDRIGQPYPVRAWNLALSDSVELRVREVLEEKLARILAEFGADKLSDVLDSEAGELDFDRLYINAVIDPASASAEADSLLAQLRAQMQANQVGASLLGEAPAHDPAAARQILEHQIPFWTEQMTLAYLTDRANQGAKVESKAGAYYLTWPDGKRQGPVRFDRTDATNPEAQLLTLEEPCIRQLLRALPPWAPGQTVPALTLPEISALVSGYWSLWRVGISSGAESHARYLALFRSDDGQLFGPTAGRIWDALLEPHVALSPYRAAHLTGPEALTLHTELRLLAEDEGYPLYAELLAAAKAERERERANKESAFASQERAIQRLGLPQVRRARLQRLAAERAEWEAQFVRQGELVPLLEPLLLLRITRQGELS